MKDPFNLVLQIRTLCYRSHGAEREIVLQSRNLCCSNRIVECELVLEMDKLRDFIA